MPKRVYWYVSATSTAAIITVLGLYRFGQPVDLDTLRAGVVFALLGLVCHVDVYQTVRSAGGTISFIPFLTAALIAPAWFTPLLIGGAVAVVEVVRRPQSLKVVFNVAQYILAAASSLVVYQILGGSSLHHDEAFRPVPYAAALISFMLTNTTAVSGVVAVSSGRRWFDVWQRHSASSLRYDIAASPLVYIFALVYNRFALTGIVFLALLLLGTRQLYRTNRQLDQTNRELLEVMVAAIELRDPYTSGHSQRVAQYSRVIAQAIGLPKGDIERVVIAALLHDVGKIDQRFAVILQKPGRLTEEERNVIELHPVISADLVVRVSGLADIVASVRGHHERWDGHGYPDRLAGDKIPLFSRIITFSDTIDAMTSDRPYRPALGMADVRAELLRNRGKQFDPMICDRLLASEHFIALFRRTPPPVPAIVPAVPRPSAA